MAEITPKRQGALVRGVFAILRDAPDGLPAAEVLRRVAETVPPTPFESTYYESTPTARRDGPVNFHQATAASSPTSTRNADTWPGVRPAILSSARLLRDLEIRTVGDYDSASAIRSHPCIPGIVEQARAMAMCHTTRSTRTT